MATRRKTEQRFLAELKSSLDRNYAGHFWYKLKDDPIFAGQRTRFSKPKPFDLIVGLGNLLTRPLAIEAKVHTEKNSWPFSDVKDHQIAGLLDANCNGFHAYIFLNWRYGLGKERVNRVFCIHVDEFIRIRKASDRKSISLYELENNSRILKISWDLTKKVWDLKSSLRVIRVQFE